MRMLWIAFSIMLMGCTQNTIDAEMDRLQKEADLLVKNELEAGYSRAQQRSDHKMMCFVALKLSQVYQQGWNPINYYHGYQWDQKAKPSCQQAGIISSV